MQTTAALPSLAYLLSLFALFSLLLPLSHGQLFYNYQGQEESVELTQLWQEGYWKAVRNLVIGANAAETCLPRPPPCDGVALLLAVTNLFDFRLDYIHQRHHHLEQEWRFDGQNHRLAAHRASRRPRP